MKGFCQNPLQKRNFLRKMSPAPYRLIKFRKFPMTQKPFFIRLTVLFSAFIPTLSLAFFCPTNFSQIDFGATLAQVEQICGSQINKKAALRKSKVPKNGTTTLNKLFLLLAE